MNLHYSLALIIVVAGVTAILRFLPFWIFNGKRKTPEIVIYLGRVLPYAIMGMLVIYCYKGISLTDFPFGIPEFIAGAVVVILHIVKRNTLLSIVGGTAVYMLLVQLVFA